MPRTAATGRYKPRFMGGSVSLNGTTSTIPTTLTSNDVFLTGNGFTMWRWVKVRSLGGGSLGNIFDKSTSAPGVNGFVYRLSGQVLNFCVNGNPTTSSASNSVTFNRWQLALITVAPNATVTHYINGIASGTPGAVNALAGITTENPLTIGNRSTATDRTFDGLMGEGGICPRVLTQAEITALYTTGQLPTGTAHHWTLDEVTGVFADSIGGATGTGTATAYSTDTPVQARRAVGNDMASLGFDGVSDWYATVPNVPSLTDFAVQVKFYHTRKVTNDRIIDWSAGGPNGGFSLLDGASVLYFALYNAGTGNTLAAQKQYSNEWVDVVLRLTGGVQSFWVNGQEVAQATGKEMTLPAGQLITLGRRSASTSNYMKGTIKTFRMWSGTVPTDDEIRNLTFSGIVPRAGLVNELLFDEGAGTTVYDTSGLGNHGTITGATWSADVPNAPRQLIGGNLVKNGDFSYVPPFVAATASSSRWIDGTAAGVTSLSRGLFGWFTAASMSNGAAAAAFDSTVSHSGSSSMKLSNLTTGGVCSVVDSLNNSAITLRDTAIKVSPSTSYTCTMWVKTNNSAADSAFFNVLEYAIDGTFLFSRVSIAQLTGTNDWTQLTCTFTTAATARYVVIVLRHNVAGNVSDAWFDDIVLTPTTPEARVAAV